MLTRPTRRLLLVITCMLAAGFALGVQVTVPKLKSAPVIDGKVSASEQGEAAKVSLVLAGTDFGKVEYRTQAWVGATTEGVYIGFVASEPDLDGLVTSTTQENGPVFQDDSVMVFLAPAPDTTSDNYFQFAVNAAGVRFSDSASSNAPVGGWTSAVAKNGGSWSAEFLIPLGSIGAPEDLPFWRGNLARIRPVRSNAKAETSAWVNPGTSLYNYTRFGYLTMPSFVPPPPKPLDVKLSPPLAMPGGIVPVPVATRSVTTTAVPSLSTSGE